MGATRRSMRRKRSIPQETAVRLCYSLSLVAIEATKPSFPQLIPRHRRRSFHGRST